MESCKILLRGKKDELPGSMQLLRQTLLETVYLFQTVLIKLLCCSYNVFYSCLRTLRMYPSKIEYVRDVSSSLAPTPIRPTKRSPGPDRPTYSTKKGV